MDKLMVTLVYNATSLGPPRTSCEPARGHSTTRRAAVEENSKVQPKSVTRQLWEEARGGDSAAYERLFALHADRLLVFTRARLGSSLRGKVDAEDILQDAYVAAHKSFREFEYVDDGAFLRWMCRIVDNRLRDMHDYYAAKKRRPVDRPYSPPTGPLTALKRAETSQLVEQALLALSPEHRQVLLLRYFEGLSAEEVGQRMERSAGAVRNLAARALVELGRKLQAEGEVRHD
jgi:RNA polymerase sigma-70 factor (ECF subfamily)